MKPLPALLLLASLLLVVGPAAAQPPPGHDLSWHVVAAGGAPLASGGHRANSTLGQVAIGPAASAGHALGAGYWYGIRSGGPGPLWHRVYLPLALRSASP